MSLFFILIIIIIFLLSFKQGSRDYRLEFCKKNNPNKYYNFLYYFNKITCPQIPFEKFKNAKDHIEFAKKNLSTTKNQKLIDKYELRIKLIHKMIYKNSEISKNFKNFFILDIGTEYVEFLDILEKVFKLPAQGINIKEGFEHYEKSIKKDRFSYYDGVNIPFDLKNAIITCFSVLHHVFELELLIKSMSRAKIIIIKENDLKDKCTSYLFDLQHDIYEGLIYEGKPSYKNSNFRLDNLIKLFAKYGKKKYILDYYENFSNLFYIIFY